MSSIGSASAHVSVMVHKPIQAASTACAGAQDTAARRRSSPMPVADAMPASKTIFSVR
ncbi:hypothetical protein [Nonomuraea dietziae]|uniref:hypothetical protein n=1 Tax=Nonomuraea dietziae TaxID=65515 RepID=UPI0033C4E2EF